MTLMQRKILSLPLLKFQNVLQTYLGWKSQLFQCLPRLFFYSFNICAQYITNIGHLRLCITHT